MKKLSLIIVLVFFSSCSYLLKKGPAPATELVYVVDLNDRQDDTFKVKMYVNNLTADNKVYQFAASAPGTYQTMDLGRFVNDFKTYDADGNEIDTKQISTNQWQISEPQNVYSIEYRIAETFDTPVDSNRIYPMCGSSIEDDHVLINGQCVFGYPTGMQKRPVKIKLLYPEEWSIGTALDLDSDGFYTAKDYDQVVDSPILTGRLSKAAVDVRGTKVEVYVYSQNDLVKAADILNGTDSILNAAADFTNGLPVDRYTFLFHFEDTDFPGSGAWEHNYSSIYTFGERMYSHAKEADPKLLQRVMAHEFFHIVTPLNIHSELVENFNFVKPQPSEHLWLYEATTEWAAQIMQLRGGLVNLDDYLSIISQKLKTADHFRKDYSLSELSLNSFSSVGKEQYINVYQKGAVTIGLLDIMLLDLSDGKRGMREVINELSKIYGPEKSFDEKNFFKTFTEFTYPQVGDFLDKYIKKAEPLPTAEYYSRIGITYNEQLMTDKIDTVSGYSILFNDDNFVLNNIDSQLVAKGLADGDIIVEINHQPLSMKNVRELFRQVKASAINETYTLKVRRGDEDLEFTLNKIAIPRVEKHIFSVDENTSAEQLKLRNAWLQNL